MPRLFAYGICVLILGLPNVGAALTLGELRVDSPIGEPLRASIPFVADAGDAVGPECVSLTRPPPEVDPRSEFLSRASIQFPVHASEIVIRSPARYHEPVLRVRLVVTCGGMNLVRDFTALLDPPGDARRVERAAPPAPAPRTEAPLPMTSPAPRKLVVAPFAEPKDTAAVKAAPSEERAATVLECERAAQDAHAQLDRCLKLRTKVEELEGDVRNLQSSLHIAPPAMAAEPRKSADALSGLSLQDWLTILAAGLVAFIGILTLKRKRQPLPEANGAAARQTLPPWLEKERRSGRTYSETKPKDALKPGAAETPSDVDMLLLEARRLMVHDRALSAIKLLDDYILSNPAESRPWMMRFVLLGARKMTREFAIAARQFKELNPEPELWANVCALGREVDPGNPLYGPASAPAVPEAMPPEASAPNQNPDAPSPDREPGDFRHPLDFSWLPHRPEKPEDGDKKA
jgi:hypothetical protein